MERQSSTSSQSSPAAADQPTDNHQLLGRLRQVAEVHVSDPTQRWIAGRYHLFAFGLELATGNRLAALVELGTAVFLRLDVTRREQREADLLNVAIATDAVDHALRRQLAKRDAGAVSAVAPIDALEVFPASSTTRSIVRPANVLAALVERLEQSFGASPEGPVIAKPVVARAPEIGLISAAILIRTAVVIAVAIACIAHGHVPFWAIVIAAGHRSAERYAHQDRVHEARAHGRAF